MKKIGKYSVKQKVSGFTLIELSIVFVAFAIVISGVAAGTSLYKQAQLNSVIEEMRSYVTAYNSFKSKYNAVPGDMVNADAFFGVSNCADNQADCNGNGNGLIEQTNNEVNKAWKHLNLSKIVSQSFPIVTSDTTSKVGVNTPISRIANAGYILISSESPNVAMFGTEGTGVLLGSNGQTGETLTGGTLTPQDAFAIDQKIDDGGYNSSGNAIGASTSYFRAYDRKADTNCSDSSNNSYNMSQALATCIVGLAVKSDISSMVAQYTPPGNGVASLPTNFVSTSNPFGGTISTQQAISAAVSGCFTQSGSYYNGGYYVQCGSVETMGATNYGSSVLEAYNKDTGQFLNNTFVFLGPQPDGSMVIYALTTDSSGNVTNSQGYTNLCWGCGGSNDVTMHSFSYNNQNICFFNYCGYY